MEGELTLYPKLWTVKEDDTNMLTVTTILPANIDVDNRMENNSEANNKMENGNIRIENKRNNLESNLLNKEVVNNRNNFENIYSSPGMELRPIQKLESETSNLHEIMKKLVSETTNLNEAREKVKRNVKSVAQTIASYNTTYWYLSLKEMECDIVEFEIKLPRKAPENKHFHWCCECKEICRRECEDRSWNEAFSGFTKAVVDILKNCQGKETRDIISDGVKSARRGIVGESNQTSNSVEVAKGVTVVNGVTFANGVTVADKVVPSDAANTPKTGKLFARFTKGSRDAMSKSGLSPFKKPSLHTVTKAGLGVAKAGVGAIRDTGEDAIIKASLATLAKVTLDDMSTNNLKALTKRDMKSFVQPSLEVLKDAGLDLTSEEGLDKATDACLKAITKTSGKGAKTYLDSAIEGFLDSNMSVGVAVGLAAGVTTGVVVMFVASVALYKTHADCPTKENASEEDLCTTCHHRISGHTDEKVRKLSEEDEDCTQFVKKMEKIEDQRAKDDGGDNDSTPISKKMKETKKKDKKDDNASPKVVKRSEKGDDDDKGNKKEKRMALWKKDDNNVDNSKKKDAMKKKEDNEETSNKAEMKEKDDNNSEEAAKEVKELRERLSKIGGKIETRTQQLSESLKDLRIYLQAGDILAGKEIGSDLSYTGIIIEDLKEVWSTGGLCKELVKRLEDEAKNKLVKGIEAEAKNDEYQRNSDGTAQKKSESIQNNETAQSYDGNERNKDGTQQNNEETSQNNDRTPQKDETSQNKDKTPHTPSLRSLPSRLSSGATACEDLKWVEAAINGLMSG